ncbi:MAG TPA: sigma-70 family RNA polymerase sigma factor, partial [Kofleriaceae bacterium]|nr:sigma-70 family RNA polymerase sigma factor [Kofleriaceae bacterium]
DDVALARARTGDPAALRTLIELYQDRVFALIFRMLLGRGTERTHDLAQETFVRVLRGLAQFDPRGAAKLSTWILTIATRVVLNERRRAGRDRAQLDDDAIARAASADRADHSLERTQLAEALTAGIAALPDDQRAVFVLREYHELEYSEIAAALEIEENTVRSRLHRARTSLRAALTAAGVEP